VPDKKQGTLFVPIPVEILSYDCEQLSRNLVFLSYTNIPINFESFFPFFSSRLDARGKTKQ
jgi:hypothetical protein